MGLAAIAGARAVSAARMARGSSRDVRPVDAAEWGLGVVVQCQLHAPGGGLVGQAGDQVQGPVDAGRDSGGHGDVAVLDPAASVIRRAEAVGARRRRTSSWWPGGPRAGRPRRGSASRCTPNRRSRPTPRRFGRTRGSRGSRIARSVPPRPPGTTTTSGCGTSAKVRSGTNCSGRSVVIGSMRRRRRRCGTAARSAPAW